MFDFTDTFYVSVVLAVILIVFWLDPLVTKFLSSKFPKFAAWKLRLHPKELTKQEKTEKCMEIFQKFGVQPDDIVCKEKRAAWMHNDASDNKTAKYYAERFLLEDNLFIMENFSSKYELLDWCQREYSNEIEHKEWTDTYCNFAFKYGDTYHKRRARKFLQNRRVPWVAFSLILIALFIISITVLYYLGINLTYHNF